MATFNKFNAFVQELAEQAFNLSTDAYVVALSNTAPSATNTKLSDITEISYTNLSSRSITISSHGQTSGTYKLVFSNLVLTASGTVGPFQYIIIYDNTNVNKYLVGWFDYGSALTLGNGDTLTLTMDSVNGFLQLT